MNRILIVEDDTVIAESVSRQLDKWGYETRRVTDFSNVTADFADFSPQLVLMDIGLPFYNGYHWCNEIRKLSKVPIIFLSSASDNMNIVMAMNMGGDDFIAKPFNIDVLVAKVGAMLRRSYDFSGQTNIIGHGGVLLNLSDGSANVAGVKTELTKNEFRILEVLLQNSGSLVTRQTLMQRLWETDSFVDENTLNVNVTRLRKKLACAGMNDFIKTKKGVGYIVE